VTDRLTKQGVRDLNSPSDNGRMSRDRRYCRHHFVERVVVGYSWTSDSYSGWYESYQEPVYGKRCLWCGFVWKERM
jgi:hypothetical protein